ncbi:MAG: ribonuclease III [Limnoraphis robusta]|uniref:Ribonuclease 3 n=1 Tax=Limnoraphis robusta CS-951 TaxID=1637645 RepID=A0A0F5YCG7_9CYAN|nr:ribonuclease III [Limnoraphis robusta]KKD36586.1 ribonuclease III [Limnoraphis robusta CS-951]
MDKLPIIKDEKLRLRALTHRSYVNEHPGDGKDNERLEFLGDAVLGFIVGELLYHYNSEELSEAKMTRLRAALVDEQQLGKFAAQLGMGEIMRLGKGAIRDGGYQNPALLSDTFEAYIGAYYLDAGIEKVREFITPLFKKVADQIIGINAEEKDSESLIDSKNRFQQWALAEFGENPKYVIVDQFGPDHAKEFIAEVRVRDQVYGSGKGRRKQDAQKKAAEAALKKVGIV